MEEKRNSLEKERIRGIIMAEEKKRLTLLVDNEIFEKFKELAKEQNRTAGNLGTKLVNDYVKENCKK